MASLPLCVKMVKCSRWSANSKLMTFYKYGMLFLTFLAYMSYHMSRKPLSVVKSQLHRNCSNLPSKYENILLSSLHYTKGNSSDDNSTWCDFAPFNHDDYKSLFGELDYAFLFTYAIGMFCSGMVAERIPIRYFLSSGMLLSGIFTAMFGLGYFANVHVFSFYIIAQVLNGLFQTTGWPAVVTVVGNWFGKQRRGLIMGIWNCHTSIGNILGSVIASTFVATNWGFSFVVPGVIIGGLGIVCFFTLIEKPEDVGEVAYQPLLDSEKIENPDPSSSFDRPQDADYNSVKARNFSHDSDDEKPTKKPINQPETAIGFFGALKIPGVVEFSFSLLFAKLVSYTFLFWLPFYIKNTSALSPKSSGLLSTLFDVGGMFGGILAGFAADKSGSCASVCGTMLIIGAGMMYIFNVYGTVSMTVSVVLLLITGAFVNGPYALITTAVSADLGTHPSLQGNAKALSTVTAIIDGTGSIGAAMGPLFTGFILPTGWQNVFWMLIGSNVLACLFLFRLILKECCTCWSSGNSENFHINASEPNHSEA